jgi:putative nucleotidyltransferase with HDIG domain
MKKEKVLIIDDEDFILQLSKDILTKSNYMVETALDGKEGLKLLDTDNFDLILTDIKMPNINGLDVIRHIRINNREIPIIVITGHGTLDIAIDSLRLGAQGFILKPFTPAELRNAVSEALEKTRLLSENIKMRALMPLFEVSKEMIGEVDPKRLLNQLVDIAIKETRADKVCISLIDEATNKLIIRESHGMTAASKSTFENIFNKKISEIIFENKKPLIITPDATLPPELKEALNIETVTFGILAPLTIRGTIIGVLSICRKSSAEPFSASDIELITVLSGQAAAAIENAHLYDKLQQSYLSMMVALSCVVESKDLYTDKHMKDIAEYSVEIANKLGLPEVDIENIRKAALLHDLGKVSIPDHILMKPGKLSEEEVEIIKKHPANGAKIIEPVEALREARDIIQCHQECFDGTGYPDGLRGEEIPLGARIISVADAFGAMTTDRPYRKALSMEEAIKELKRCSGTQFDPQIVGIFLSVLKDKGILNDD